MYLEAYNTVHDGGTLSAVLYSTVSLPDSLFEMFQYKK
jgi:hypothetical protein